MKIPTPVADTTTLKSTDVGEVRPTSYLTDPGNLTQTLHNCKNAIEMLSYVSFVDSYSEEAEVGRQLVMYELKKALGDVERF